MTTEKKSAYVYKFKKNGTFKKYKKTFHNVEMSPSEYKKYKSSLKPTITSKKSFFQKRSEFLSKKTAVVSIVGTIGKLLGIVFLFLLFASFTRKMTDGSLPSFSSLLGYLSTFNRPTIPFRNANGYILGFLEFVFLNAIQGFEIFFKIIYFMFFG